MLKKENRICLNKDFDRTFKSGKSFYGQNLKIKVINNNQKETRFGIIISSKVSKKAVIRNKYRRLIREIVKNELARLVGGKDVVFIVFDVIINKKKQEIEQEIVSGFQKLKLLKN